MFDMKEEFPEVVKGPVDAWTDDRLTQLAAGYKTLAQDPVKWQARWDTLVADGESWDEDLQVPPYILRAIGGGDVKTLKRFAERRGGDPKMTALVKELLA